MTMFGMQQTKNDLSGKKTHQAALEALIDAEQNALGAHWTKASRRKRNEEKILSSKWRRVKRPRSRRNGYTPPMSERRLKDSWPK